MAGPERRAAILAVARGLFARQGYHGTSTGDIARAADCSEAVLYRHFASKQALFSAVMVESSTGMRRHLVAALGSSPDDPVAGLTLALARMSDDPDVPDHLRLRSVAVTMVDEPEIRGTLEGLHESFMQLLTDAARTSQELGRLRADVSPEQVAQLFSCLGFKAAFTCALGGPTELRRLTPAAETLLAILRPTSTPIAREGE